MYSLQVASRIETRAQVQLEGLRGDGLAAFRVLVLFIAAVMGTLIREDAE